MKRHQLLLLFIFFITAFSIFVALPKEIPIKFQFKNFKVEQKFIRPDLNFTVFGWRFKRDLEVKKGLDLAGGTHLVYKADMNQVENQDRDSALEAARANIERRINLYGVSEPAIWTSKIGDEYRLIVELPGVEDVNQAIDLIGQTAQLEFREGVYQEDEVTSAAIPVSFKPSGLTGKDLKRAQVQFDSNTWLGVFG